MYYSSSGDIEGYGYLSPLLVIASRPMPVPMIDVAAATLLVYVYQSRCYCAIAPLLIVATMLLGHESNGTINE